MNNPTPELSTTLSKTKVIHRTSTGCPQTYTQAKTTPKKPVVTATDLLAVNQTVVSVKGTKAQRQ